MKINFYEIIYNIISGICFLLGIACFCYFWTIFYLGNSGTLNLVWLAGAVFFFTVFVFRIKKVVIPNIFRRVLLVILSLGISFVVFVEGCIFMKFDETSDTQSQYVIVLGNSVLKNGPSEILKERLDTAAKVAMENPNSILIVSGGQVDADPIAEAIAMKQYLVEEKGIPEKRIILEDKSKNTFENLTFSLKIIEDTDTQFDAKKDEIVIVTSNFHMFRTLQIAKKVGFMNAQGQSAKTALILLPQNLLRELLSIVKNTALRRM